MIDKDDREFDYRIIEFGTYPGILFGMRTYVDRLKSTMVFYIPFFDICIKTVYKPKYNKNV